MIQEELQKVNPPEAGVQATPQQPAPQPLELNIMGSKYTFNSHAEMEAALNNTFGALQQQQAAPPPEPAGRYVTDDQGPKWDQDKYIELMKTNPVEAAELVDNFRYFGGKHTGKVSQSIKKQLEEGERAQQFLNEYQFLAAHPEFQRGPQNAQIVHGIRQQLNLPPTFDGLEAAYLVAQQRGFLPAVQAAPFNQPQNAYAPAGYPQNPQPQPQPFNNPNNIYQMPQTNYGPPAIGRGASAPAEQGFDTDALESLPLASIKSLIEKGHNSR
jgi:hypothetical protein